MAARTNDTVLRLVGEIDGRVASFVLPSGEAIIGCHPACGVRLNDATVSRRHARLRTGAHEVEVEDLGSTNGVRINGVPCDSGRLRPGDWLEAGAVALLLQRVPCDDARIAISADGEASSIGGVYRDLEESTELVRSAPSEPAWLGSLRRLAELRGSDGFDVELVRTARELAGGECAALTLGDTVCALDGSAEALATGAAGHRLELSQDAATLLVVGTKAIEPVGEAAIRLAFALRRRPRSRPDRAPDVAAPQLRFPATHVVGRSAAASTMYAHIRAAVRGQAPVLSTGETGVGKEHVVRILHASSDRAGGPLRSLNCAAIPADLLEAELFGIESGVATGVAARAGAMRSAHRGILFFDEVGDMAAPVQAKLLRALQEREVHPVGGRRPVAVDVRIVAATNTDLEEGVRRGSFRADLYYRLAAHVIHVPSLRERREDIPELVARFLVAASRETGVRPAGLSLGALRILQGASWPGNVRQLELEIRRAVSSCAAGGTIESGMLAGHLRETPPPQDLPELDIRARTEVLERDLIRTALERTSGNRTQAAQLLGLSRNGLALKLARLGLE